MLQGCPLSPFLFSLLIKPHAQSIRTGPSIKGLDLAGHQHKRFLFADDILIFMSCPHISAPNVISKLDHFAHVSGLIINSQKSKALNISLPAHILQQAQTSLLFSWSTSRLLYLGITLTPNLSDIFTANYPPIYIKYLIF